PRPDRPRDGRPRDDRPRDDPQQRPPPDFPTQAPALPTESAKRPTLPTGRDSPAAHPTPVHTKLTSKSP
ncbi:hypothetical protein FRZ00_34685, partial [Streptomyces mobaraensis]